jgi:hypothetical protein
LIFAGAEVATPIVRGWQAAATAAAAAAATATAEATSTIATACKLYSWLNSSRVERIRRFFSHVFLSLATFAVTPPLTTIANHLRVCSKLLHMLPQSLLVW